MAGKLTAMRERPKAVVVLALLFIGAGLTLGLAREAIAYSFDTSYDRGAYGGFRDSDGQVPESSGRLNPDAPPSSRTYHVYGRTTAWSVQTGLTYVYNDSIVYDWREVDYCNRPHAGLYDHERAHSRGWGHGKENFTVNKAYYSSYPCRP